MNAHNKYKRVNITLPEDVYEKFLKYCDGEGMNLSSRIAVLIKRDINPLGSLRSVPNKVSGFKKSEVVASGNLSEQAQKKLERVFKTTSKKK